MSHLRSQACRLIESHCLSYIAILFLFYTARGFDWVKYGDWKIKDVSTTSLEKDSF